MRILDTILHIVIVLTLIEAIVFMDGVLNYIYLAGCS
jgi:hypothetical protein